jgi:3-hydroxyacyl-CoA dehydrogenase
LLEEGETADAYKEAKDHDQWILKAIQEQIDLVQQGTSDEAHYSKMNTILTTDTEKMPIWTFEINVTESSNPRPV